MVDEIHKRIFRNIRQDNYQPDVIVAIARGGLVTATHLAYLLSVDQIVSISIRRPGGSEAKDHAISTPILDCDIDITDKVHGRRVLVVDGAIGTGRTLHTCFSALALCMPAEIRVAVMAAWSGCPKGADALASLNCRTYLGAAFFPWPIFPWEN